MELIAEKRNTFGKKTKSLRREMKIPAVLFGKHAESIPLVLDNNAFIAVYKEAGENTLVDLKIGTEKENILISEVQLHPVTDRILHVCLHRVDLSEKITAEVPVVVVGEEANELVKSEQAIVLVLHSAISVEALPTDLPHEFEVDVSALAEIGDGVTAGQLSFDRSKVELVGVEDDEVVAKLDYAEMQEVEEEEEVSEEELVEGIEATEETAEEGEDGAETTGEEPPSEETPQKED